MKPFFERHASWILPVVAALFVAYRYAMEIPGHEKRIQAIETRQAVTEAKLDFIVEGVKEIRESVKRRR